MSSKKKYFLTFCFCFFGVLMTGKGQAQEDSEKLLDRAFELTQASQQAAADSQKVIDDLSEATHNNFREYKGVLKEVEGLRVYNARLEKQIQNQLQRIRDIEEATRNAVIVQRQIPALTSRMIEALDTFISLDTPFHSKKRAESIQLLRNNLNRSDVTIAEKFRQVLEVYKIENEYGRKIDTYRDTVKIDGVDREVNILRIGRVALLYQTTDGDELGVWDSRENTWVQLGRGAYRTALQRGLRIARKQAAIELMKVPVPGPEVLN